MWFRMDESIFDKILTLGLGLKVEGQRHPIVASLLSPHGSIVEVNQS